MKIFLLVFLFCSQSLAHGFLGNPGKGILLNDKIFLLDLYSLGIHNSPFVGETVHPQFENLPDLGFDYPKLILSKKLSDIEAAIPGMGVCILESLKAYDWFIIAEDLKIITDDNDPVVLPPGAQIVQVANRLRSAIRINLLSWQKLDDANKVALLIHEAIYSFVTPQTLGRGVTIQSSTVAKELTGRAFTSTFKGSNYALGMQNSPSRYGLNIFPNSPLPTYEVSFDFYVTDGRGARYMTDQYYRSFQNIEIRHEVLEAMKRKCAEVIAKKDNINGFMEIEATTARVERNLQKFFYGVDGVQQMALRFQPLSTSSKEVQRINTTSECLRTVVRSLEVVSRHP